MPLLDVVTFNKGYAVVKQCESKLASTGMTCAPWEECSSVAKRCNGLSGRLCQNVLRKTYVLPMSEGVIVHLFRVGRLA